MQKSLMKLLGVAVLTWSSQANAVGMGSINVSSALGQPLQASIELVEVSDSEKAELKARLAPPEVYRAAGLEYPAGVNFTFSVSEDAKTLIVKSDQTISAPFVTLLVELTWAAGKLQRDFTFLLDPEGYTPEQPKLADVQPVEPDAAPDYAPVERRTLPSNDRPVARKKPTKVAAESVTVKRGDTLAKVAAANKPADVSLERMIVAMYRINAKRFDGQNMNRIGTGTVLRIPSQQEINNISTAAAKQEIQVQARDWNAYRQQIASSSKQAPAAPQAAGQQSSAGQIGGTVTDKAPVAAANPNGMLKLSAGDAPTDKTVTTQDKQNAKQEDTIAKAKATQDEQVRAQLAAQTAADTKQLLELKAQAAALASAAPALSGVLASSGVLANGMSGVVSAVQSSVAPSTVAAASPVKPAHPLKPVTPPKPTVPEKSFVDDAMDAVQPAINAVQGAVGDVDPLYLAGGAAVVVALGGAALFLSRRKKKDEEVDDVPAYNRLDAEESTLFATSNRDDEEDDDEEDAEAQHPYTPPPASLYPGQNTGSFHTPLQETEDEEDPIEEARLFLSFGRDAQAEDILNDALKKTPNNHQIHLELLGIYANRKDINAFAAIAHQLKDTGDETVWAQAAALGRKLEPSNNLYLRDGEQPDVSTQQLSAFNGGVFAQTAGPVLDFDLGGFTSKRPAITPTATPTGDTGRMSAATSKLDVNIASATAENPALSGDSTGKSNTVFDVTAVHPTIPPSHAVKALSASTDMSMDFTMPEMTAMTPEELEAAKPVEATAPASPSTDLPFSIDFAMPDLTPPVTPTPVEALSMANPMSTMDFAVPDLPVMPPATPSDDKTSFSSGTIDFAMPDLSSLTANTPAIAPKAPEIGNITGSATMMKMDFGGLNLNIGGETSNIPVGESTSSQSIANKLDLARVYIEMEDPQSAREFIEEVIREGNPQQVATAKEMLQQLG